MATKFSFARLFFHVPATDKLDEKYDQFKSALRRLDTFVELDFDDESDMEGDNEGAYYIIVLEGKETDIPSLEKQIDKIVDKVCKS